MTFTANRGRRWRGAGEQAFHGVGQPPGGPGRPHDRERHGAAGQLPVEDQEREAAEVIAVQVGDEHGGDLAGVEPEPLQRGQRGGAAVQQHRAAAEQASEPGGVASPGVSACCL